MPVAAMLAMVERQGAVVILPILLALSVTGGAEPNDEPLPPLTGKDVRVRIVADSDQRFYPEAAQFGGIEGRSSALCVISERGALENCQVESEEPAGYDFGAATLRLTSQLRIEKKAKDGSPTAGRKFRFDMNFKLPR